MKLRTNRSLLTAVVLLLAACGAHAVPEIQSWRTPAGAKVLFVETDSLPIVDARVVFNAGGARDGDHPGLAMLTNALLSSGANGWDADEIAERLERVGARMTNESLRDMAHVSLRSLSEPDKLDAAVEVVREVIADPAFDRDDLERDRRRLEAMIRQKQQQPGEVAGDAFYRLVYDDHPYAHPPEGTLESIAAIEREDLIEFHRRYYVARNAVVAIVGDLDREQAAALARQLTDALPGGEAAPALPVVALPDEAREEVIPMPTSQTHVVTGQPGIARGDPDYFPLYVGNHVLGGSGFASRLMQVIREDRGLVYDVHSYFVPMAAAGPFQAGLQTRNEQAVEARRLMIETIERFRREGPTKKELGKAVKNITGGFPLNLDSNADLLGYIAMIGFYDLPLDYLDTFSDKVHAVTVEQIRDAFARRLHPDRFVTVIVGGAASEE